MGALYRYVFRGFGLLMLIGMITFLLLAVKSQIGHKPARHSHRHAVTGASQ